MRLLLLTLFIGANLSEERFFPEPLSKDFYFVFFAMVFDSAKFDSFAALLC